MFDSSIFPTEQNSKLSENSNSWPEALNIILSRRFPELSKFVDKVVFSKVEKVRGYAVGYILMQKDAFRIPFIIENFMLMPLDIYIKGGKYGYLSKKSAPQLIGNSWPFKQISAEDNRMMFKTANCFEVAELTIDRIEKDPKLLKYAEMLSNDMPEMVLALGRQALENQEMSKLAATQPSLAGVHMNEAKTKFVFEYFNKTAGEYRSLGEAVASIGRSVTDRVMTEGSVSFGPDVAKATVQNDDLPGEQFSFKSGSNTQYPKPAALSDGMMGYVRGNIYELRDIKAPSVSKNYVFMSTRQADPVYYVVNAHTNRHIFLTPSEGTGTMGALPDDMQRPAKNKSEGMAFGLYMGDKIFGPFEITGEAFIDGDSVYSIRDGYEYDKFRLHVTPHVKNIIVDGDDIFAPQTAKLIWLGKTFMPSSTLEKTAAVAVRLVAAPDKNSFSVIDGGVTGMPPAQLQGMSKTKTISALMHSGLSEEESKLAIQKALQTGTYTFQATPTAATTEGQTRQQLGKTASDQAALTKTAQRIVEIIDSKNLIKIASDRKDGDSVELVLGLRLITPQTVARFRLLLPRIGETLDGLCKLMLSKRLGGNQIPIDENKLKTSIESLAEIEQELTGV